MSRRTPWEPRCICGRCLIGTAQNFAARRRDDPVVTGLIGFAIGIATGAALALGLAWPW